MLFVVAYISFFDNELKQFVVKADNEFDAIYKSGVVEQGDLTHCQNMDEVKGYFFDCDAAINVTQIEEVE